MSVYYDYQADLGKPNGNLTSFVVLCQDLRLSSRHLLLKSCLATIIDEKHAHDVYPVIGFVERKAMAAQFE